ncbi:RNA polymerase sigma factor [Gynurincola endophyticus]|uniref:RNA polymerase sigma factor n=1 Tax=Gynurincola endophyticus TaxID=2479004 RepID=UPI000F8EEBBE|nr:RNA polymerase sigma-70 factor [Gynurincola endophyticus]
MLNKESTDQEIWEEITCGSLKAFNLLFDRYWDTLYTTAYSYLNDQDACVSVVQDIFTNIWIKRKTLSIEFVGQYLKTAARYHIYKEIKKLKSVKVVYSTTIERSHEDDNNAGEHKLIGQDLESWLDLQLSDLPTRCQEIFRLSRKEGFKNEEIAEQLGISKRTVENQITMALQHIRKNLKNITFSFIVLSLLSQ